MGLKKPCIQCGTPTRGSYCPPHTKPQPPRRKTSATYAETKRRRQTVEHWRLHAGDWCPGWNRPAHPSVDLTADHINPRARHGDDGPLRVLCRACNSARGAWTRDNP